jgi:hypothetical protein
MPSAAALELFLGVGIVQFALVVPVARQVFLQPASEVPPEHLVCFAEFEIHRYALPMRSSLVSLRRRL